MKRKVALLAVLLFLFSGSLTMACSAFLVSDGTVVLAGNNEDYWNPFTNVWFIPKEDGKYGRVCFGVDDYFAQGGMNEAGLFFDGFATAPFAVKARKGGESFKGNLIEHALETCATVEEVVALFEKYDLSFLERAMLLFGDRSGDAVIIEGDRFLRKKGRFQLVTNFYQSQHDGDAVPCERFRIAKAMLDSRKSYDVDFCRSVLAAVHNEKNSPTTYSNIYDLKNGIVYLYHFHNFENVVVFDLAEELKKGKRYLDLPSLFPRTFAWEIFRKEKVKVIEKRNAKRKVVQLDAAALAPLCGAYAVPDEISPDTEVYVFLHEGSLCGRFNDGKRFEMKPESGTRFFLNRFNSDYDFTFQRDKKGKVTGLVVEIDGKSINCSRKE